MTFTTLATVHAPTLQDGLVELLRISDALQLAGQDCGVSLYRDTDGRLLEAEASYELPAGVLEDVQRVPIEPWRYPHEVTVTREQLGLPDPAHLELLELLAHVNPDRDLLATAEQVGYL